MANATAFALVHAQHFWSRYDTSCVTNGTAIATKFYGGLTEQSRVFKNKYRYAALNGIRIIACACTYTSPQGVISQPHGLNSQDDVIKSLKIVVVIKSTILVYLQVEIDNVRTILRSSTDRKK